MSAKTPPPLPNEIPLKVWIREESERRGMTFRNLQSDMYRGKIPFPPLRRVNQRVIYVQTSHDKQSVENGANKLHL